MSQRRDENPDALDQGRIDFVLQGQAPQQPNIALQDKRRKDRQPQPVLEKKSNQQSDGDNKQDLLDFQKAESEVSMKEHLNTLQGEYKIMEERIGTMNGQITSTEKNVRHCENRLDDLEIYQESIEEDLSQTKQNIRIILQTMRDHDLLPQPIFQKIMIMIDHEYQRRKKQHRLQQNGSREKLKQKQIQEDVVLYEDQE